MKILKIISILSLCALSIHGQLPVNVNFNFGSSIQGTSLGSGTSDWIYGVKSLNTGETVVTGYGEIPGGSNPTHPIVMLVDAAGSMVWEQCYTCIEGIGFDVYEHTLGFVIIGRGQNSSGCSAPSSMFSMLVDKTTGAINQSWGVKFYNEQTVLLPEAQNALVSTIVNEKNNGKPRSCEILNNSGVTTGYMICGNYNDNSHPSNASTLTHFTTGSFLIKIDLMGRLDPSFGNSCGLQTYFQNTSGRYYNPHLQNVCVNYGPTGIPIGYVVVGDINENIYALPSPGGSFNRDAIIFMTDLAGNITFMDVYDDMTHQKWGTSLSYPYTDTPDAALCPNTNSTWLPQENNNEKATRVRQKSNGGGFIILNQFDYTLYNVSSCSTTYPNSVGFILADPVVMEMDPFGNILWTKNVFQSTGRDFENDLLVRNPYILVLGMTLMEPNPGTPLYMKAVVSKLDLAGNIIYEQVYTDNSSGQTRFCPFDFDFDNTGGIIIGGDNSLNSDDYQFINVNPY